MFAGRTIAALPAGGATPLAAALDLATCMVTDLRRDGGDVTTVLLTDGRANVGRDGVPGRARGESDALSAAARLRAAGGEVVYVDAARRPEPFAQRLIAALCARSVALSSRAC